MAITKIVTLMQNQSLDFLNLLRDTFEDQDMDLTFINGKAIILSTISTLSKGITHLLGSLQGGLEIVQPQ